MIIKNLNLKIKSKIILEDVSFNIKNKTAFVGPNGSGKTMTLSVISQLIRPNKGTIFNSKKSDSTENLLYDETFKDKIGVMIQKASFNPNKTVMQELQLIQKLKDDKSNLKTILDKYNIENVPIKSLPHGKHKILLVLQALMGKPKLVILDEPFSGLDIINRKRIQNILKSHKGKILITTNNLNEIKDICSDIVFIKEGRIIEQKTIGKIKNLDKYYIKLYS
jgi:ABC-2 type transport system ATP-binding protein